MNTKSCWKSNKDGKVIKKFSRLVGQEELFRVKSKIPN
jgi:hypothetical protein